MRLEWQGCGARHLLSGVLEQWHVEFSEPHRSTLDMYKHVSQKYANILIPADVSNISDLPITSVEDVANLAKTTRFFRRQSLTNPSHTVFFSREMKV